jgi:hypothetical protein
MAAHSPTDVTIIRPVLPDQPQAAWAPWLRDIAARVNEIGSNTTQLAADTDLAVAAWSTYTPTIGASSGTITTASGTGRYKQVGKTVHLTLQAIITANGTGSVSLTATLPVPPSATLVRILAGRENQNTGKMLQGVIVGGAMQIFNYDNSYPAANGNVIYVTGTYEAA